MIASSTRILQQIRASVKSLPTTGEYVHSVVISGGEIIAHMTGLSSHALIVVNVLFHWRMLDRLAAESRLQIQV